MLPFLLPRSTTASSGHTAFVSGHAHTYEPKKRCPSYPRCRSILSPGCCGSPHVAVLSKIVYKMPAVKLSSNLLMYFFVVHTNLPAALLNGLGVRTAVPQVQDGGVVGGGRRQEEEHSSRHQEGLAAAQDASQAGVRRSRRGGVGCRLD